MVQGLEGREGLEGRDGLDGLDRPGGQAPQGGFAHRSGRAGRQTRAGTESWTGLEGRDVHGRVGQEVGTVRKAWKAWRAGTVWTVRTGREDRVGLDGRAGRVGLDGRVGRVGQIRRVGWTAGTVRTGLKLAAPGRMPQGHEKLVAWQRADDLFVAIHRFAATFPIEERYGLTSQMRRAAYSVPANIVEGMARRASQAGRARKAGTERLLLCRSA